MIENPPRSRRHFPQLPSQITEPSDPGHGNLAGSGKEGQGHFLKSKNIFPTFTLSAGIVRFGYVSVNCETTHIAKAAKNVS